jgi:hypothetical protein
MEVIIVIMEQYRDREAHQLTANDPAVGQVWLYELKTNQVARPIQLRGGAPATSAPKCIFAYAEQDGQKTVRLYIPRNLVKTTLSTLKMLPFFSYITEDDIETPYEVNLMAAPDDSLVLDIAVKDLRYAHTAPRVASVAYSR